MRYGRTTMALALTGVVLLGAAAVVRSRGDITPGNAAGLSTASPGVRFVSVALGGFRGLLADALWVRASGLQDEGRFYEIVQLADWITQLEPRHAEVWAYHAWNLAYNIGAMFPDPADKWRWVSHGVRLLRDQGIPANPRDDQLHWELGWLYIDKIGGSLEEAQLFYRVAMAMELTPLFPGGRADYAALAEGPAAAALAQTGLQPGVMRTLDEQYGPFDWRLPATHAIYWGYTGRQARKGRSAWCARLVYQGLLETVRGGQLRFDPARRLYVRAPRLDVAARAARTVASDPDVLAHPVSVGPAENLLRESLLLLYAFGRSGDATNTMRVLNSVPGVKREPSLEACVHEELVQRVDGLDDRTQERIMVSLLSRRAVWTALGDRELADGFDRLARLQWRVILECAAPASSMRQKGAWELIEDLARSAARDELPAAFGGGEQGGA